MSSYPVVLEDKFLKIAPIITPMLVGGSVVKDVCARVSPVVSITRWTMQAILKSHLEFLTMNTQRASCYSIIRPAERFLPAMYLAVAMVVCSLMPFALPAAWGGELQDDSRVWGAALARGNFGYASPDLKRWLWWMDGQLRARDCCSSDIDLDQSLIRPGLGYALTDQSTVWMGYARATNYLDRQGGGDRGKQNVGAIYVVRGDAFRRLYLPATAGTTLASKRQ